MRWIFMSKEDAFSIFSVSLFMTAPEYVQSYSLRGAPFVAVGAVIPNRRASIFRK